MLSRVPVIISVIAVIISFISLWKSYLSPFKLLAIAGGLRLRIYPTKNDDDIFRAAATLWKEFGHIFGMGDGQLPSLKDAEHIDIETIKKKV